MTTRVITFTAHMNSILISISTVVMMNEFVASRIPPLATAASSNAPITNGGLDAVSKIKPRKYKVGHIKPDQVKVSSYRSSRYML